MNKKALFISLGVLGTITAAVGFLSYFGKAYRQFRKELPGYSCRSDCSRCRLASMCGDCDPEKTAADVLASYR